MKTTNAANECETIKDGWSTCHWLNSGLNSVCFEVFDDMDAVSIVEWNKSSIVRDEVCSRSDARAAYRQYRNKGWETREEEETRDMRTCGLSIPTVI